MFQCSSFQVAMVVHQWQVYHQFSGVLPVSGRVFQFLLYLLYILEYVVELSFRNKSFDFGGCIYSSEPVECGTLLYLHASISHVYPIFILGVCRFFFTNWTTMIYTGENKQISPSRKTVKAHFPRHPNTSWEGVLGMFLGSKYLLRRCLDV